MKRKSTSILAACVAAGAVAIAGCGGSSNSSTSSAASTPPATSTPASPSGSSSASSSSGGGQTLKIAADASGQLKFNKSSLRAKAGKVTITMANPSAIPHGVAIQGSGVNQTGQVVQHGGTSTVTVTLKKGTYTFYCPVPGHRQAGMQGTLTIK